MTKKPDAIIFDWDNTLIDSWQLIGRSIDKTLTDMGKQPWGINKVKKTVYKSMRESFPAIFGNKWQEAGEIYQQTYHNLRHQVQFLPDAKKLIEDLTKLQIPLFIISNKVGDNLRFEVKKLQIDQYFFSVIGAGDAKYDKPDPAPVDLALLGSNLDPKKNDIWFVGDAPTDLYCAINSGCKPILFGKDTQPHHLDNDLKKHNIDYYQDHKVIIDKIRQW